MRVKVFPGVIPREEPGVFDAASGGAEIGPVVQMASDHVGEGFGKRCGFFPEGDAQFVRRHDDRGCRQPGDPDQRLCVEQQQRASEPVGKSVGVASKEFLEPGQPLVLGECGGRLGLAVTDLHGLVDLVRFCPDEERANQVAGGRP